MTVVDHLAKSPRCPDCETAIGKQHEDGCSIARCVKSGLRFLQCGIQEDELDEEELELYRVGDFSSLYSDHTVDDCDSDVWDGLYPGKAEAVERGWFGKFILDPTLFLRWVPCDSTDPEASLDLNRVYAELVWCPISRRLIDPPWLTARLQPDV